MHDNDPENPRRQVVRGDIGMEEQFPILVDFFARELLTMVMENYPSIALDDVGRIYAWGCAMFDGDDLEKMIRERMKFHLGIS